MIPTSRHPAAVRERNEARCRRIVERSESLAVDDLAWPSVGEVALPEATIHALVYMRDVEGFTPSYLTGLGAHRTTHADPLVRAFFAVWLSEEQQHSAALDRYLSAYGAARHIPIPRPPSAPGTNPGRSTRLLNRVGGPVGALVATSHMAWGAANELLTMNGYRMLAAQTPDPVLVALLERIAAQEARHYSFYLLQAEWRLASSRMAQRALRRVLGQGWTPVGIGDGYKTHAEFRQVVDHLTSTDTERIVDRMDNRLSALPGLAGLRIYRRAFLA